MFQRGKLKFIIRNLLHFKEKSNNIKSRSDNNNKDKDISTNTGASVPSLKDMKFN